MGERFVTKSEVTKLAAEVAHLTIELYFDKSDAPEVCMIKQANGVEIHMTINRAEPVVTERPHSAARRLKGR